MRHLAEIQRRPVAPMQPQFRALSPLFLVIVAFWLIVFLQRPSSSFIADGDTFWHLEAARWMIDNLSVPHQDSFSYTANGQPWIDQEWLSELIFFAFYRIGHWAGVVLLTAAACALTVTLLTFELLRHLRLSASVGWAAITAIAISAHFLARPHVFSFIIIVVWLSILLDRYDKDDLENSAWILAPLMALWANLHASFMYGLSAYGLFSIFALGSAVSRRNYAKCWRLALAGAAIAASSLITPYGIKSMLVVLEVSQYKFALSHIPEWRPPDFQIFWIHSLLLVGLIGVVLFSGIQMRGPRLVLLCMNLLFGLEHLRGLVLFFLTAPILLAKPVALQAPFLSANLGNGDHSRDKDPVMCAILRIPAHFLVLFAPLALLLVMLLRWHQLANGPSQAAAPRAAIDFVQNTRVKGNVFNTYVFGGYLIFRGIPVFIDGRQPPYSDDFVRKTFEAIDLVDISDAYRLLDEYSIAWAILTPTEALTKALAADGNWVRLYSDSDAIIFARKAPLESKGR